MSMGAQSDMGDKMTIAVYAIAKNEAKFVNRWVDNMGEADSIFVLDTGSTDGTQDMFRSRGVTVKEHRMQVMDFGAARNMAMAMAKESGADILVCTDIDEVFSKGWADKVRKAFKDNPEATTAACKFITKFNPDGTPCDSMHYWKIHRPCAGAVWNARVHEYLTYHNQVEVFIDDIILEHHPDPNKSRGQYIDLLRIEADTRADPRSVHYYGRELMFAGLYHAAIKQFVHYLGMPDANWNKERAYTMRYIGRCYGWLKEYDSAIVWFLRAAEECREMREPLCDLSDLAMTLKDWNLCTWAAMEALKRKNRDRHYFTEEACWTWKPYDNLSVGLYNRGRKQEALMYAEEALRQSPSNERIAKNIESIRKEVEDGKQDFTEADSPRQDTKEVKRMEVAKV